MFEEETVFILETKLQLQSVCMILQADFYSKLFISEDLLLY